MPLVPEEVLVPQCRVYIDGSQIKASDEIGALKYIPAVR